MKKLHQEGVAAEMGEIALNLFYQLQKPGTDEDGEDPDKKNLRVFNSIRSIFGLGEIDRPVAVLTPAGETLVVRPEGYQEASPDGEEDEDSDKDDRYPSITAEDWKARERARKLLRNILTRQVEVCETQRKVLLRESLAGPSPYELAAEVASPARRDLADAPGARCQPEGGAAAHQLAAENPASKGATAANGRGRPRSLRKRR